MLSSLLLPPLIWACLPDTQRVFEFKHQPQKHWECPPHLASRTSALGSTNFKDFAPNDALFLTNAHTFFSLSLSLQPTPTLSAPDQTPGPQTVENMALLCGILKNQMLTYFPHELETLSDRERRNPMQGKGGMVLQSVCT